MHAKNQEILRKMDLLKRDDDVLDQLEKAQRTLYGDQESIKLDLGSVKESFQRLSNKIASRSRPGRSEYEERKPAPEPEPEDPRQTTIDFPFNVPNQQPPAAERPAKIIMQPKKWRAA